MTTRTRGQALLSLLLLSPLMLMVLLIASAGWLFQSNLQSRLSGGDGARHLAESAVSLAVARLLHDPELPAEQLEDIDLSLASYPGGTGRLSFKPLQAQAWGIPQSLNNLSGRTAQSGWASVVVEPESANLVAVGRFRGVEERLEVVLHAPRFPYVVCSSVPVLANNGLRVFGVSSLQALADGYSAVNEEQKVAGHVVTNAEDAPDTPALQLLGAGTEIEGDAQARGEVILGGGAVVRGEARSHSDSVPLPELEIADFDVADRPGMTALSVETLDAPQLAGFNRRTGNLEIHDGLTLEGGVLFVQGDLTVRGGVRGTGALIVTGAVRIEGGSALTTDHQAAILAGGPVTLQGTPEQRCDFRGLVYTEGDLNCQHANIAGAVVVNNPDPQGRARLEEVTLVECAELASLDFEVLQQVVVPGGSSTSTSSAEPNVSSLFLETGFVDLGTLGSLANAGQPGSVGVRPDEARFATGDPENPYRVPEGDPLAAVSGLIVAQAPSGASTDQYHSFSSTEELRQAMRTAATSIPSYASLSDSEKQEVLAAVDAAVEASVERVRDQLEIWAEEMRVRDAWLRSQGQTPDPPSSQPQVVQTTSTGDVVTTSLAEWKLDYSQFLKLADRVRILAWRKV